jgi:hypothetical protein
MEYRRVGSKAVKPEVTLAELQQGLAAVERYAEQHGSFSELVRDHYERVNLADVDSHDPAGRQSAPRRAQ